MTEGAVDSRRSAIPWTGIGRYVAALYSRLPDALGEQSPSFLSGGGLRVVRDGIARTQDVKTRTRKVLWEQVALPAWLARHRPSFIHLPWHEGPWTPRCPLIVTIHDIDTLLHPTRYSLAFRAYYNELLIRYARLAKRVLVVSETTARDVDEHLLAGSKTVVIPQGIDSDFWTPNSARGLALLSQLGVPKDRPVLLSAAGTGIRKNLSILGAALKALALEGFAATLVVTQTSRLPDNLEAAVQSGIRVVPAGILSTSDLAALYAVCDVSLCPSIYEGFGFALVESMAAGCPVICSSSGSHPEIAGGAAILFDPGNADELASHIRSLLADASLASKLRLKGRDRAKLYDWRVTIERTIAVYKGV